jgi:hypothetical protein
VCLQAAQAERDRFLATTITTDTYTRTRDLIMARCWAGRPALADALLSRLDGEPKAR